MRTNKRKSRNIPCQEVWRKRIMIEKGISERRADKIAQRSIELTERMQYGHVMIAFHKQDGTFCLEKGTLVGYEKFFHRVYRITQEQESIVYWNVEQHAWRRFKIENLLEWKAIV